MPEQFARVPTGLLSRVDASALQLYVALCAYARRGGHCYPSNAELSARTGQSPSTVKRSLQQLCDAGAVERKGRQRRMLRVVPIESLWVTGEPKDAGSMGHERTVYSSPMTHVSRPTEVETDTLTAFTCHSSEPDRCEDEPMTDDQLSFLPEPAAPEPAGTTLCMRAFFDAYGKDPISRSMIGRLGKTFKDLCGTYGDALVSEAAREMGLQRCANPNAAEAFVLRLRARQTPAPENGWSLLARDTFDQWKGEAQNV